MANNTKYIPSGQWTYLGYRDKDWNHVISNKNIRSGTWITIRQEFNGVIAHIANRFVPTILPILP